MKRNALRASKPSRARAVFSARRLWDHPDSSFSYEHFIMRLIPQPSCVASALCLALMIGPAATWAANLNPDDMNQQQKYSYAQGYAFAQKLQQADLSLDAETFAQAVRDGLEGKASVLTPQQIQEVMNEQKRILTAATDAQAKRNDARGKAFLAENKGKPGVKELLSGVQYEVLQAGDGKAAGLEDKVTIHYEGRLLDDTVFDSSYARGNPATFGVNQVVPGFSEALQNMREGDIWRVVIPAHLAYGARGAGKNIGPNETLVFKIELLEVK